MTRADRPGHGSPIDKFCSNARAHRRRANEYAGVAAAFARRGKERASERASERFARQIRTIDSSGDLCERKYRRRRLYIFFYVQRETCTSPVNISRYSCICILLLSVQTGRMPIRNNKALVEGISEKLLLSGKTSSLSSTHQW